MGARFKQPSKVVVLSQHYTVAQQQIIEAVLKAALKRPMTLGQLAHYADVGGRTLENLITITDGKRTTRKPVFRTMHNLLGGAGIQVQLVVRPVRTEAPKKKRNRKT